MNPAPASPQPGTQPSPQAGPQPSPEPSPGAPPVVVPGPRTNQTILLLVAVVLAVAGGMLARYFGPHGASLGRSLGQLGQLWLNALRMTLVPLIFCLMTTGVASLARTAAGSTVARIAVAVFLLLMVVGSLLGVFTVLGLTALWPVAVLHAAPAALPSTASPSLLGEFVALVPSNPFASAAETAIAPLIVFAAFFGAAIVRINATWTALLLDILSAIPAALLVIVGWVLRLAPVGTFCLLFATVTTVGSDAARGLLQYAIIASIIPAAGILIAELIGIVSGCGSMRFLRAALPPQTLAATTQSSTACLPALLQAATVLRLSPAIVNTIMPLAVTTFRFGNVFSAVATGILAANLYGLHPTAWQIATAIGIGILTNIGSVGVPGAAVLLAAWGPVYLALGAPLESLTLYLAVITGPDICITTANVTADLAATSLIARLAAKPAANA